MEYNIEVDENDNILGLRPRDDFYTGKYIHRASQLILKNPEGKILLHMRSNDKVWGPGKFNYSSGGTVANESYEECIIRETKEELGIEIKPIELFKMRDIAHNDNSFQMIYTAVSDDEIKFDKREIQYVKWVDEKFLREDMKKNPEKYTRVFLKGMKIYFNHPR